MKNLFKTTLTLILITMAAGLLLLISSCGDGKAAQSKYSFYETVVDSSKPLAWGDDRDIYVFCDATGWKLLESFLRKNLERETFVVINEKYFRLVKADINEIDKMIQYKNLLFIGDLKTQGGVSEHLRKSMLPRMRERVANSGGEMFIAKNRWVKDQLVIYLVGSDLERMTALCISQANRLYETFLNRLGERLAYQAYQTKVIPEASFDLFPFAVKIPDNYRLFHDDKAGRFLSFIYRQRSESRDFPDKYISVYYEDAQSDSIPLDWLREKRKELAFKYYDGDEIDFKMLRSELVDFGKYRALSIMGPWVNKKYDIGGGFKTFAFYDAKQKRRYLIDTSVYYPAGDKLPVLLELERIASTFKAK